MASMSVIISPFSVRASTLRAEMANGDVGSTSMRNVSGSPRPTMCVSVPLRAVIFIRTEGDGAVLVTMLWPIGRNGALCFNTNHHVGFVENTFSLLSMAEGLFTPPKNRVHGF